MAADWGSLRLYQRSGKLFQVCRVCKVVVVTTTPFPDGAMDGQRGRTTFLGAGSNPSRCIFFFAILR